MNPTSKGSLAALAAATLLLGGAGSLAYWNDSEALGGADIHAGRLDLGTPSCGDGWLLDGGAPYVAQELVPGDTLTEVCQIDLTATGEDLGADLAVSQPSWAETNALTAELQPVATFTVNGQETSHITSADDQAAEPEIQATITIQFPAQAATNDSQQLTAALQSVSVTATQSHDGAQPLS